LSVGDSLKDLIILGRQVQFQYMLDTFTTESLKMILPALDKAMNEIIDELSRQDFRLTDARGEAMLEELTDLSLGIRLQLGESITEAATYAADASLKEYGQILSFNGQVAEFNFVALSPEQLRAFVAVPFEGYRMDKWIDKAFNDKVTGPVRDELLTGYFKGESTGKLVARIDQGMDLFRNEAITLARTFIADVNNRAAEEVYKANADIITHEEWNASLEVSMKSGTSTCLRCASLDSRSWPMGEEHVRPPLHFR